MTLTTLILILVIWIPAGILCFICLQRRKTESDGLPPHVEREMTVSEFNQLIEEREPAAKAPLVSRIGELEKRLQDGEQEVQALKAERKKLQNNDISSSAANSEMEVRQLIV